MNMKIGILAIGIIALIAAIPVAMAVSTDDHGPSPKIEIDNNTINFLAFNDTDYFVINITLGMTPGGEPFNPLFMEFRNTTVYTKGRNYQVSFFLTEPEGGSPNSIAYEIPENWGLEYPVSVDVYTETGGLILQIKKDQGYYLDLNYI